jgi:hypothetical protein
MKKPILAEDMALISVTATILTSFPCCLMIWHGLINKTDFAASDPAWKTPFVLLYALSLIAMTMTLIFGSICGTQIFRRWLRTKKAHGQEREK